MAKMAAAPKFVSDGKGGIKKGDGKGAAPVAVEQHKPKAPTPKTASAPAPADKPKAAPPASTATDKKKETYDKRMRKLAPIERVRRKIASTILRFDNLQAMITSWKNVQLVDGKGKVTHDLGAAAQSVRDALESMASCAEALPDDFAPTRDRKARESHLQPKMKVTIRKKAVEGYEGVIDTTNPLEVVEVRKGRVVCKTQSGEKVFLPRGHLQLAGAVETTDSDEDSDELEDEDADLENDEDDDSDDGEE